MFASRAAAGRALARLVHTDADRQVQVLAVSRDGIAVAAHIAAAFGADLEILCARRSSIAIVVEDNRPHVELDRVVELGLHAVEVKDHLEQLRAAVDQDIALYRGHRPLPPLYDCHVIVVDDGSAPAPVLLSAVRCVRERGAAQITVAVPACALETLQRLADVADDVVCIDQADPRGSMFSYADTDSISDVEALTLLGRTRLAAARVRALARQ
jgi:predicted phosphoribosyltransferase